MKIEAVGELSWALGWDGMMMRMTVDRSVIGKDYYYYELCFIIFDNITRRNYRVRLAVIRMAAGCK